MVNVEARTILRRSGFSTTGGVYDEAGVLARGGARTERRLASRIRQLLRRDGDGARPPQGLRREDRRSGPEGREAGRRLARVPGLRGKYRIVSESHQADRGGNSPGRALGRLPR